MSPVPWRNPTALESQSRLIDRLYDFANTPVIVAGKTINDGEPIIGHLVGRWRTRSTTRSEFEIVDIEASMMLPAFRVALPSEDRPRLIKPVYAPLSLGSFEIPDYLLDLFPAANQGTIDPHHRTYRAVLAFDLYLPTFGDGTPAARVLMRTMGIVEEGGALTASGMGMTVGGRFPGVVFSCGHTTAKPIPVPPIPTKCTAQRPGSGIRCAREAGHEGLHFNPTTTSEQYWD